MHVNVHISCVNLVSCKHGQVDLQVKTYNDLWGYFRETYIPEESEVSVPQCQHYKGSIYLQEYISINVIPETSFSVSSYNM